MQLNSLEATYFHPNPFHAEVTSYCVMLHTRPLLFLFFFLLFFENKKQRIGKKTRINVVIKKRSKNKFKKIEQTGTMYEKLIQN